MSNPRQLCTFTLNQFLYGIEVIRVQEVIRYQDMTRVPLAPPDVRGLINLRGQIVVAIDTRRRLGLPEAPPDMLPMNVVIRTEEGAASLLVDEIGDVIEVSADDLDVVPELVPSSTRAVLRGVYKLPSQLLLELDVDKVVGERDKRAA